MAMARHPKATFFVQRHLFAGVTSFAELEQKIVALPDEKSRGDAFEVFAEAYLATQRKHDAAQVWPHSSVPLDILKNLGLTQQDQGIDGVLQTLLGKFTVYQIKFRTGRPSLTWRELSTFIGLADSPQIHSRVLITNCDELAAVLNERQGFFCIRGSDLDRLEADDFRAMEAWLADAAFIAPKKSPQPHQIEALDALLPALQTHDRVSAIMACGTGKTLVALWVAEKLAFSRSADCPQSAARGQTEALDNFHAMGDGEVLRVGTTRAPVKSPTAKILVLLPSLALLRQTLHEWLRETHLSSLAYLCVCSDPTVKEGIDALTTQQSDLDFQVSTNVASVRSFLDAPFAGVKMIFSTYQSASVVGAAMQPGEAFDFAVFDEAHKTAGREGRNFAFALDDKNLPIRKRLFLTATPRHYNPLNKNKDGDAQLVFSMDNAVTYGQQIYRLPFSKAAKRGIICRYKVVISVITSQQVTNELLSHGEVLVNGDAIRARQVANQIALKEAVTKYGVNKIFTFHSTVASAASFTSCGNGGVAIHLPDFKTLHVNGKMPTAAREREMRDFRNCKRGIISNARCLTEGVDVPAVDMVAFLAPRRSRVDIVQATGRAMRLDPANKKTTGYILVPLYLEQATNESVEQAVLRSDFSEVWEVLQSLQEQDEVLSEIIRDMRMERGCMKGFDDSRFRERVEVLGTQLTLNDLRKVITTKCIEILADNWEERFGELQSFKMRYGHCNVPSRCSENPRLGLWITNQRQRNRIGKLSVERVRRLEEIGFVWTPFDAAWEDNFARLAAYKQEHGHCNVRRSRNGDQGLASWLHHQRKNWKFGSLDKEQLRRLKELEVVWSPFDAAWEEMFAALLNYKQIHGNCNVPQGLKKNSRLASWVHTQRGLKNRGQLDNDRVQRLEKKGFVWDRSESVWEEMFELLKRYKSEHGNCKVPARWSENPELATWVHEQRKRCRRGKLSQERINKLEQIVFWNSNPVIDKE